MIATNNVFVYNNTLYGNHNGIVSSYYTSANPLLINNVSIDNDNDYYLLLNSSVFNSDSKYNISSDGTAPGTNSKTNTTVEFVDATNNDFHLATTDIVAKDAGIPITNYERCGW